MATQSAVNSSEARSGGKMVRARRVARIGITPYHRPPPAVSPQPSNLGGSDSNWLSRLLLSPTRFIANGAGKVIASVFGPVPASASDYSSNSGSVEDEDEDEDEDDEEIGVEEYMDADLISEGAEREAASHLQDFVWSTDSKRMIAQIIIRETFSRDEGDRLKQIIESRVSDSALGVAGSDAERSDLRNTAIIEAKKWLEEKKNGSGSKPELEHGPCILNSFELQNEGEIDIGSPVDVAKSYMQTLTPWSSSSLCHMHSSPSLNGPLLLKDDEPGTLSKQLNQSPLSGSWSIMEEVRKVRSRATEDLLRSRSSTTAILFPVSSNHEVEIASNAANSGSDMIDGHQKNKDSDDLNEAEDPSTHVANGEIATETTTNGFISSKQTEESCKEKETAKKNSHVDDSLNGKRAVKAKSNTSRTKSVAAMRGVKGRPLKKEKNREKL